MAIDIVGQMEKILDDYSHDVKEAAADSFDQVSKEAVGKLKSSSPKRKGKYASGWTRKKEVYRGISSYVVHNKTCYQLTHLLENGHVVRNKKGTYGRAPARPHIKPVEEWAQTAVVDEIERNLK